MFKYHNSLSSILGNDNIIDPRENAITTMLLPQTCSQWFLSKRGKINVGKNVMWEVMGDPLYTASENIFWCVILEHSMDIAPKVQNGTVTGSRNPQLDTNPQ